MLADVLVPAQQAEKDRFFGHIGGNTGTGKGARVFSSQDALPSSSESSAAMPARGVRVINKQSMLKFGERATSKHAARDERVRRKQEDGLSLFSAKTRSQTGAASSLCSASERMAFQKYQRERQWEEARRAAGPQHTDSSSRSAPHGGRLDQPSGCRSSTEFTPPEFQPPGNRNSRGSARGGGGGLARTEVPSSIFGRMALATSQPPFQL